MFALPTQNILAAALSISVSVILYAAAIVPASPSLIA